jgi:ribonuclease J
MMMMEILRRGAVLHSRHSIPSLHTSGHAGQSEQRRMIELVRPRAFLPIHGTLQHLMRHAELARSTKVSDVLVVENGTSVVFDERGLRRGERVPFGKIAIAQGGEPISAETLRRRAELGRTGVATVSLAVDRRGALISGPNVTARGIPGVDDEPAALRSVARAVGRVLERAHRLAGIDLTEDIRRAARRELFELCGSRPVVEVHLLGPHD